MAGAQGATMIRAFLAVELPEAIRSAVASFQGELKRRLERESAKEARISWVQPASMHLTIKFLGDTDEQLIAPLRDAVAHAIETRQACAVPIERLGAFPQPQGPRVLWVGPSEEWERGEEARRLSAIHRSIEEGSTELGFPREAKPFNPHLTLARIKAGERQVGNGLVRTGIMEGLVALGTLAIDSIVLMKSDLRPSGSVYTKLWQVRMRTG
jgi:RNA 2',3'-cyclic 3'-phosphodiesterase